jgi:pantoate--beta-alanine ligase
MEHVTTIAEARARLDEARRSGYEVGLVATMGFLHEGHLSLIERSVADNDFTLVTIFVNPLQFAPEEDLDAYPRDLPADLGLCERAGVDLVLAPGAHEMYPEPPLTKVTVALVTETMEGERRPTHFAGVATIVSKLFNIAGPCRAYFGEKDYQQLVVIRRMVEDLSFPVEVVGCPIVRESNGLAMSSRNTYLSSDQRDAAAVLNRSLEAAVAAVESGERDPRALRALIAGMIADTALVSEPDYIEIVDADTLTPLEELRGEVRILLAARVGKPRLLDNMGVSVH